MFAAIYIFEAEKVFKKVTIIIVMFLDAYF